jgi:tRNA-dihydrouridine synthase A
MQEYARKQTAAGVPVKHISRHMLGLFQGLPGARSWRRWISENAHLQDSDYELIWHAYQTLRSVQADLNEKRDAA